MQLIRLSKFSRLFCQFKGRAFDAREPSQLVTARMANNRSSSGSNIAFANKLESESVSFDLSQVPPANNSRAKTEHSFYFSDGKKLVLGGIAVVAVSVLVNCLLLLLILSNAPNADISTFNNQTSSSSSSSRLYQQCPVGWKALGDLKCFKVFDQMTTHYEAFELCQAADPASNLLNIQTEAEQAFMEKLLFSDEFSVERDYPLAHRQPQLFNPVWLFGRWHNLSGRIAFDDGVVLKHVKNPFQGYSNWADGSKHRFLGGRECTQMLAEPHHHHHLQHNDDIDNDHNNNNNNSSSDSISSSISSSIGKWVSVRCQQKSAVVCQRLQNWSPVSTQKSLLKWSIKMEHQQKEIESLKTANQVPVGFVYVQLPKEPAPAELWPATLTWQDISATYAGVFFRVAGEGASAFGQLQNESSPHLAEIRVKSSRLDSGEAALNISAVNHLVPGQWTDGIDLHRIMLVPEETTSSHLNRYTPLQSVQFKVASEEVRPRNMAVKVWKRVK